MNDKELKEICEILSNGEQSEFKAVRNYSNEYNFFSNNAELNIITDEKGVIISRVALHNRRKGTFTKVYEKIVEIAKQHSKERIVIEFVLTKSMEQWCFKNGFKPNLDIGFATYGNKTIKSFEKQI